MTPEDAPRGPVHAGSHPWWHGGVVYQIYPRSFQDATGNGTGDLRGIVARLDHLVWLGVDALWLSPIYASPMEDGGYDVTDHTTVDEVFGSDDDADTLIAAAHDRGLRVVLDFVPNHTSHHHPWFVESRRARNDPRRQWYLWQDSAPGGGPPNNWRAATELDTAGSAWTYDAGTDQWYLGTFSRKQPDLRWSNSHVRDAMADIVAQWMDRGVDGLRIDMASFLAKDDALRDEPEPDNPDAHDYFVDARYHLNRPETLEHLRALRALVDTYDDRVLIGEMLYHEPIERLTSYATHAGIDLPTNFSLIDLPMDARAIADHVDRYDAAVRRAGAWPNWVVGNHDQPRVSALGPRRSRVALMLLLTLRGTPFLYYGDEIGMTHVDVPHERRHDRFVVPQHDVPRDAVRTPMQWDAGPNAGFCAADVMPWLPLADDVAERNVAAQRDDPNSVLTLVRRLLALRRQMPALALGEYRRLDVGGAHAFAFARCVDDQQVVVVINFGETAQIVDAADVIDGSVLAATEPITHTPGSTITVPPRAGVLLG